jgi:hypothetical protein
MVVENLGQNYLRFVDGIGCVHDSTEIFDKIFLLGVGIVIVGCLSVEGWVGRLLHGIRTKAPA